tara:strand:- start:308 stop:457 length:150 start_codon:yes stop_codon:yes gene_type:complete
MTSESLEDILRDENKELKREVEELKWRLETRAREIRYLKVDILKLKEME